jgi:hypothetical protein
MTASACFVVSERNSVAPIENSGVAIWSAYARKCALRKAMFGESFRGVRRPPRNGLFASR